VTLEIAAIVPSDAQGLLEASGLPLAGLEATSLWAARHAGAIVGVAGLERYGDVVLLRSVATEEGSRGQGVAATLCQAVLEEGRAGGARQAFLLTETASGFFRRLGFEAVPREAADPRLSASAEFQEGRCASAQLMSKRL
jgi:amino-acid N-acetyltransferase